MKDRRTTRTVEPTAEGLAYHRHACQILEQVDEMEAMLRKRWCASCPAGECAT